MPLAQRPTTANFYLVARLLFDCLCRPPQKIWPGEVEPVWGAMMLVMTPAPAYRHPSPVAASGALGKEGMSSLPPGGVASSATAPERGGSSCCRKQRQ